MVDGLGELVGAVASGAVDASGISTNAAYDVLKGIGQKALARVMEPAVRNKIHEQTVTNLQADGMGADQAAYLVGVVREKGILERGAKEDPTVLIRLMQTEVLAAGHSKEESSALLTALARAVAQHTSAEPGTAIASVQTLLNSEQLLSDSAQIQRALSQVLQQTSRTPRKNADDLAAIMRRAGQMKARLELDAYGRVRVRGQLELTMRATGETAKALEGAVNSVERGEEGVVRRLGDDDLFITTGDPELDELLKMGTNATILQFVPTPIVAPIIFRARGTPDIQLNVTVRPLRNPARDEGVEYVLVDRAHMTMIVTVRPTTLDWHWRLRLDQGPITEADRGTLEAIAALARPGTKLYHGESGAKLLNFPDTGEKLHGVAATAQFWLSMLDVWAYLREELPEVTFTPQVPDASHMPDDATKLLRDIQKHVAGTLVGTPITITIRALITPANIAQLSSGKPFQAGTSPELHLPGWTPLQLSMTLAGDRPAFYVAGQRVSRRKLAKHMGKEVEFRAPGKITSSALSAAPPESELPDSP